MHLCDRCRGKMPKRTTDNPPFLRFVNGKFQYQRGIPADLWEATAKVTQHREPTLKWFIKSTGTGDRNRAIEIRDAKLHDEYKALIVKAQLHSDPAALAAKLIGNGRATTISDSFVAEASARLQVLFGDDVPASRHEAVTEILANHYTRERKHIDNVDATIRELKAMLFETMMTDKEYTPIHNGIMSAATVQPAAVGCQIVESAAVINGWIAERTAEGEPPKPQAINAKRSKLARLFAFVAGQTDLPDRLDKEQIAKLLVAGNFGAITKHDLKRYRARLMGEGIAYDHIPHLRKLFKIAHRNGLVAVNPADNDITVPRKAKNRRPPFSDAEAKMILEAARNHPDPVIRWGHWVGAFSTFIPSEILNAKASEIHPIEEGHPFAGVWVWDTRERPGKSEFRPRIQPIPERLIHEGFLDYVASRAGKMLFDGSTENSNNKLNDFLHDLGIAKTFYSWRHRNIHRIDKLVSAALSRYIAGHAGKDIHEKFYLHHDLPEEFGEVITAIDGLLDPTS